MMVSRWLFVVALSIPLWPSDYAAPAGTRPAMRRPGAPSILPGGRIIAPIGRQYITGPGPFGLVVGRDGRTIVSVNSGPERFSLTVLEKDKKGTVQTRHLVTALPRQASDGDREDGEEWRSAFMG